jgi:hypothetical protein
MFESKDGRTIEEFHATRESGAGCPMVDIGTHYFAFIDPMVDGRICIDCGEPEQYSPKTENGKNDV